MTRLARLQASAKALGAAVEARVAAVRARVSPVAARAAARWAAVSAPVLGVWNHPVTRRWVHRVLAVLSLVPVVWTFRLFNDVFLHHGLSYDEAFFTCGGWYITKGLALYRDYLETKPPFVFLTHALALALYGYERFQFRWFFLWFPLGSLLALQLAMVSRKIPKLCAMALALGIVQLWVNHKFHDIALSDSESIGLTYYFLGVACLIARLPWPRAQSALRVAGGAFLLCCAQSKEPFLPCAGLTWVACFFLEERRGPFREDALRYVKLTGLGGGLMVLGLCIYLIPSGAMKYYVQMARAYARYYSDPSRGYCVVIGRFHPTTPLNDLRVQYEQARKDFLNLAVLGYLLPFAMAFLVFVRDRSRMLLLLGFAAFMAALWAFTASKCQWMHYYVMAMSGLFFALVLGLDSMSPHLASPSLRRFVGLALLSGVLLPLWPRIEAERPKYGTRQFGDFHQEWVPGQQEAVRKHTKPGDRIFTDGYPALYVQTDRQSAVRESVLLDEMLGAYDGNTDEERLSGVRAQLEANMPKIVVFDQANEKRKVRLRKALLVPFLAAHKYQQLSPQIWLRPY